MHKGKRMRVIAGCLALAAFLAACEMPFSLQGDPGVTLAPASEEVAPSEQPTETLTLWTWKAGYQEGFRRVAALANLKLEITVAGTDTEYQSKVKAAANAKTLPDVLHYWAGPANEASDALLELSGRAPFSTGAFRERIYPRAWETVTISGEQVALWQEDQEASKSTKAKKKGQFWLVPTDVGGFYSIFAQRELLEKAGIAAEAPETWEALVANMAAFHAKTGKAGLTFSTQHPNLFRSWCWTPIELMYNGAEGYAEVLNPYRKIAEKQRHIETIGIAEDLAQVGMPGEKSREWSVEEGYRSFAEGEAGYLLGGSFSATSLRAMGMDMGQVVGFPIPALEGSRMKRWTYAPEALTGCGIAKNSQHQDAATRFLESLATPDGGLALAKEAYTIPAAQLGSRTKELPAALAGIAATYVGDGSDPLSKFREAHPVLKLYEGATWMTALETELDRVLRGETSATAAAQACDTIKEMEIEAGRLQWAEEE